jgi:hypothetical protein
MSTDYNTLTLLLVYCPLQEPLPYPRDYIT